MDSLAGKVIIITGASEGLGACLAAALRKRGANLCLTARNVAASDSDLIVRGDVTMDSVRSEIVTRTVERWGKIDILINNAGRGSYYPASTTPLDEARAVFDLNFFAPLALSQLALPFLRRTRGTLVNIASIAAEVSLPWLPIYSASKFALAGITAAERTEFRRDGVHVMGVFPGYVDTDFQAHAPGKRPPARVVQGKRFAVSAEECTEAIIHGMTHKRRTIVTPRSGWLLVWANRFFPSFVESQLERALYG